MFGSIDKSLSELLKKTANKTKVWFLSYIDSKKRIFANGALMGLCPLYSTCLGSDQRQSEMPDLDPNENGLDTAPPPPQECRLLSFGGK